MPLSATNFVTKGPVLHADLLQFFNLFTGVMTDQPVTFKNVLSVGGNQANTTVPLKVYGATGQTSHLLDLYQDPSQANPGWGIAALGLMAWGPGGAAPTDTTLSRVATQNGHASDTAGLLVTPYLEVAGNISATTYLYSNGASITGPAGSPLQLTLNQDLAVNRNLSVGGTIAVTSAITAGGGVSCVGVTSSSDGWFHRNSTLGYVWLGTPQAHYIGYDGTQYVMPSGNLQLGGNLTLVGTVLNFANNSGVNWTWNGSAFVASQPVQATSQFFLPDGGSLGWGNGQTYRIINSAGNYFFDTTQGWYFRNTSTGYKFYVDANGNVTMYGSYLYIGGTGQVIFINSGGNVICRSGVATGAFYFQDSNSAYTTLLASAFTVQSAERTKTNIVPLADPLSLVLDERLHGVSYDDIGSGEHRLGFVAEAWLERTPEVVVYGPDGQVDALDYDRIGAITFEALKQYVTRTEARLAALERKAA